jgi:predicted HTH transcriptional regulator
LGSPIVLEDVYEGWFVDYKRECQNIKETAKSLSAFANQFGGGLFIGIGEGKNGSMKTESFPGVRQEDVSQLLVRIRDAATGDGAVL